MVTHLYDKQELVWSTVVHFQFRRCIDTLLGKDRLRKNKNYLLVACMNYADDNSPFHISIKQIFRISS
jgi:hypothetical protein